MKKNILFSDYTIGLALSLIVLALFHFQTPLFVNMELMFYDMRAQFRQIPDAAKRGDEIAIVEIDNDSITNIGRWPWPRWRMVQLIDQLSQYGPKVIAVNLLFSEPESNQGLEEIRELTGKYAFLVLQKKIKEAKDINFLTEFSSAEVRLDNDTKLINSITQSSAVVLAMSFSIGLAGSAPPADNNEAEALPVALDHNQLGNILNTAEALIYPPVEAAGVDIPLDDFATYALGTGHVTVSPDDDGVLRQEIPIIRMYGKYYPSFALQAVRNYMGIKNEDIRIKLGECIQMGSLKIPLNSQNRIPISYVGPGRTFSYFSFYDVINQKVDASAFKRKIVLVGFTASGLGSLYTTPITHNFQGVEYLANVIQNMLHNNYITRPQWARWAELGSLIIIGLFVTFILPKVKAGMGFFLTLLLAVMLVAPSTYTLVKDGYWIKIFYSFFLLSMGYTIIVTKKFFTTERKKELVEASEIETNKMLGLSFQGQGQLDLAFEKFRKCPLDESLKELLYNLGLDFERKRQFNKAVAVYEHVSKVDPRFKDLTSKIDMLKKAADGMVFGSSLPGAKGGKEGTVMIDSAALKPTLGRYEIIKELGRGAMGVVYLGKDPKINRTVAIKTMIFDDDVDEATLKDLKERFFREAESAGKLSHPNIVRIFDAGEDQDMAYIAMELMEGDDLKKWTAKDSLLPIPQVLDYVAKSADALDYAHQEGVFHRDIKPANIMLLKDSSIRVADFGIARIQGSSKTATGTVLGTPSYMSPEQIAGKKVDGRSDLFSLGVTLYELLTGEKPFKGGDAIGTLLFQIANDPHPDARMVRPELPAEVILVINKSLEKNPDNRYQRGNEMAQDLKACLQKLPA